MDDFISSRLEEEDDDSYDDIDLTQFKQEEDEQPLDLVSLPQELIISIVEKLNYKEYTKLEETSRDVSTVLNNYEFSLAHAVDSISIYKRTTKLWISWWSNASKIFETSQVRWHVATQHGARIEAHMVEINCRTTRGRIKAATRLFEKNKTTAHSLRINEHVTFQPEDLDRLITVLQVRSLNCSQFLPREFFQNPENGLNKLNRVYCYTTGCTDEELLKLKVTGIDMTSDFISDRGLNKFLKQWKKGEREISWVTIEFGSSFGTRNFDRILAGLDANPIWTPDMHEHSLVGAIKLEEFSPMTTGDPEHLYSIWRPESCDEYRLLSLSQGSFEITEFISEAEELFDLLDGGQYYEVTKTCIHCREKFCHHRRKYSVQRFKRAFPRVSDAIFGAIQMANMVLETSQDIQCILEGSSYQQARAILEAIMS